MRICTKYSLEVKAETLLCPGIEITVRILKKQQLSSMPGKWSPVALKAGVYVAVYPMED